jgi:CDP-diacylglycerol--glycerol-3-phosphate 3-phosphatidyltransferase
MNLANRLTLLRILLVPVFLYVLLSGIPNASFYAAIVFIIASITDFFDGYIARSRNMVTKLGKLMDPLADKILVTAALVGLVELNKISSWFVVIILSREFIVSIFRAVAATEGIVIAASWWGKLKTNAQMIAIILLLLNNWPMQNTNIPLDMIMLYIATALTIISGYDYIAKNKNVLKN